MVLAWISDESPSFEFLSGWNLIFATFFWTPLSLLDFNAFPSILFTCYIFYTQIVQEGTGPLWEHLVS